jgi:hypothetical protein
MMTADLPPNARRRMIVNRMKRSIVGIAVVGFVAPPLLTSSLTAQQTGAWAPTIAAIPSPAGPNTGEPQLTVSARGVLLSWVEHAGSKTTLRFAERTPNGWSQPRTAAAGDDWSINGIDVPAVLRLGNGTLVAQWLQTAGGGMHANDVRLSYSTDDGKTWARSFTPYRDESARERLFASLFEMSKGDLGVIWLSGAGTAAMTNVQRTDSSHAGGADHAHQQGAGHQEHGAHAGRGAMNSMGEMTLRFATFDGAWKLTAEMPIDLRVCECCSTAAVVTSEGVLAAYRNRSDDEIRDIYVSRFAQRRWSEPAVVHADNWRIPACPINGPALSARERDVAIVWYTVKQDQGHGYAAFSHDAGRSFGEPVRLDDTASLGRVDVEMLPDGSALASWMEVADGRSQFRTRRIAADGNRSSSITVASLAGSRTSPRIARHGDEVVFAWTETSGGATQVRTASARLPSSLPR